MNANSAKRSTFGISVAQGDQAAVDNFGGDSLALFCWSDIRPLRGIAGYVHWRLCGAVSHAIETGAFVGDLGEVMLMPGFGRLRRRRLFVFGLGAASQANRQTIAEACQRAFDVLAAAKTARVTFAAPRTMRDDDTEVAFVQAIDAQSQNREPRVDRVLVERLNPKN